MAKKKELTLIDLFAGCGGLSEGFARAGFKPLSAVEIDHQIANTLKKNHPQTKVFSEDICNVESKKLLDGHEDVDIIVGGPPCQGFSMAGKRIRNSGIFLDDPRNQLFKEFYRIVSDLKPKIFLMENVPGILNIHNGEIREMILDLYRKLGYDTSFDVLLASEYGVPQMRKRAYFIGNRLGLDSTLLFPTKTHGNALKDVVTIEDAIFDLPFIHSNQGEFKSKYDKKPNSTYQKLLRGNCTSLHNHISSNHDKDILSIMKMIPEGKGMKDLPEKYKTKSIHSGAYGRMLRSKPAYTITTRFDSPPVGRVTHPIANRTITAREAARLQSFADNFIFHGSKSSIGIQIGNAVPPLLAQAIAQNLKKYIRDE
ncbi:DNA cytosine methyltransferase [Pseudomonadota bacterium]|nr:DNA cytosine methyltransferase [Pseudomonadota bacterium]